ncbi:hypothetical protein B4923_02460 [Brenneria roseae subsp. americana]|uniref:Uncharacterized protein n=1 Tax=Brenneria roseae subsp. americana TaxID=1508507 RepID=A0A2U1TZZ3_9GAMM|nr:hypothetical protein B4923_02460 [Brenneria roseae subsp. americana]
MTKNALAEGWQATKNCRNKPFLFREEEKQEINQAGLIQHRGSNEITSLPLLYGVTIFMLVSWF